MESEQIHNCSLADDILRGCRKIGEFTGNNERRTRYLVATGALPVFREGEQICMRKTTYMRMIEAQEDTALASTGR